MLNKELQLVFIALFAPSDLTLNLPEKYQGLNRENGHNRFPSIKFWTQDDFSESRKQKPDNVLVSGSNSSPSLPRSLAPLDGAPAQPFSPSASPPPLTPSITKAGSASAPAPPSTSTSSSSMTMSATGSAKAPQQQRIRCIFSNAASIARSQHEHRPRRNWCGIVGNATHVARSQHECRSCGNCTSAGPIAADTAMPAPTAVAPASTSSSGDSEAPLVPDSAPKKVVIVNPISQYLLATSLSGHQRHPQDAWIVFAKQAQAAQEASKSKPSAKKEPSLATAATEEATASNTSLDGSLKKVTGSISAKNICYKEYLKSNAPLMTSGFEKHCWRGLPREMTKRWNDASKLAKSSTANKAVIFHVYISFDLAQRLLLQSRSIPLNLAQYRPPRLCLTALDFAQFGSNAHQMLAASCSIALNSSSCHLLYSVRLELIPALNVV
ncbi:hypothetical protein BJ912DRAFT_934954 [Pholiota molesta]|nr:hypothetical protein BJ912DRAFT_934954 [Pholiota molesta]